MNYDPNITSRFGITLVDEHTVRKTSLITSLESFLWVKTILNHFINHPDPMVVPVYKFEEIGQHGKVDRWANYEYAYEMKRLGMLDEEEKNIIAAYYHTSGGTWRPLDSEADYCMGLRKYPQLIQFLNVVYSQRRYTDTHAGNFMKDEEGNYLIIDLEGFSPHSLNDPRNDWISR